MWRLNDVSLRNVETMEILGNVFNSKGNNTSHVDNRLNKCRQSFYGLNSLGMSYPGAAPEVQAHLYKSICQPVLTYGIECMSYSKDQFRRMESTQGRLIKQCLGLSKSSHNTAMLKALNIEKVQTIVDRNVLNLYHRPPLFHRCRSSSVERTADPSERLPILPVLQGHTKNSPLPPSLQGPCVVLATFEHFKLFYLLCFYNYFTMHFNN